MWTEKEYKKRESVIAVVIWLICIPSWNQKYQNEFEVNLMLSTDKSPFPSSLQSFYSTIILLCAKSTRQIHQSICNLSCNQNRLRRKLRRLCIRRKLRRTAINWNYNKNKWVDTTILYSLAQACAACWFIRGIIYRHLTQSYCVIFGKDDKTNGRVISTKSTKNYCCSYLVTSKNLLIQSSQSSETSSDVYILCKGVNK